MDESRIELQRVSLEDASVLRNLLQLYVYDLSVSEGFDVNEHGLYKYRFLDNYWTEAGRLPLIVRFDGSIAGFVLVNRHTYSAEADHAIAEFFIMRRYRRQGIGTIVAHRVFDMLSGWWEVVQTKENTAAQAFWRSVLAAYDSETMNDYPQGIGETDRPVQTVRSKTGVDELRNTNQ